MFGAFTFGESYPAEAALVTAQPFGHGIRVRADSDQLLTSLETDERLGDALGCARGALDRVGQARGAGDTLRQAGGAAERLGDALGVGTLGHARGSLDRVEQAQGTADTLTQSGGAE